MKEYDVIIIGAGISGLSCAVYLKRAGIKSLIIENNVPGGQLNKIDIVENYPGFTSVTGFELASNLLEQVSDVDMEYGSINKINYEEKLLELEGNVYKYNYLVFATGRREKLLGLDKESDFIGRGISLCATCDGALYKDKEVVVVGGANSAVSEAIYLANICSKVTLIYRKSELRAENILKQRLEKLDNVNVIYNDAVIEYKLEDGKINGVKLKSGREVDCACVFLAIGSIPNSELFDGVKDNDYIVVDKKYETSIKDVYACGDVIVKDLYQLVTASSEGASVANNIIEKVNRG